MLFSDCDDFFTGVLQLNYMKPNLTNLHIIQYKK